ncbi:MAG: BREX-1 system phosphatase PglZ type B [Thermodesulfobacteriota bacterium]
MKSQFAFDPENHGLLAGSTRLAEHAGPWKAVWERFRDAPQRYPGIRLLLQRCKPPMFGLFDDATTVDGWPQWNEAQETVLRHGLLALDRLPAHEARTKVLELEAIHGSRRRLVWAELGEAPLVCGLEHLAVLAETTRQSLAAGALTDLAAGYRSQGWRADDALLRALGHIETTQDFKAVAVAIRAIYLPWAEESARYLQDLWKKQGPKAAHGNDRGGGSPECVLFVDGLRFDCAKRLVSLLKRGGFAIEERERWAALPTVTGTGKPAVAPLVKENAIAEEPGVYNFDPLTPYQLRKALEQNGWTILDRKASVPAMTAVDPPRLWVECGDLDHEGHDRGWRLARQVDVLLAEVHERIAALVAAGWKRVRIVTDHGWLLLPGGLPKVDLPASVVESKWGRCAAIKPGASTDAQEFPWHWNSHQHVALADGAGCFRKGEEYAHGGISLQECLTLELTVTGAKASAGGQVILTDVVWRGLRCTVGVEGDCAGLALDIRTRPGNPDSSVVFGLKPLKENGTASVVVADEDLEGRDAVVVLIDKNGGLVAQLVTVIGGGRS